MVTGISEWILSLGDWFAGEAEERIGTEGNRGGRPARRPPHPVSRLASSRGCLSRDYEPAPESR